MRKLEGELESEKFKNTRRNLDEFEKKMDFVKKYSIKNPLEIIYAKLSPWKINDLGPLKPNY